MPSLPICRIEEAWYDDAESDEARRASTLGIDVQLRFRNDGAREASAAGERGGAFSLRRLMLMS